MIDWNRVNELVDEVGAEDFDEVIDLFLEEVDGVIETLRTNSTSQDLEAQMHFIKGSALNIGFSDLAKLCQQAEFDAAQNKNTIDTLAVIECFMTTKTLFLQEITQKMAG